ncbi:preprotein translocase subunit SecE [Candidatus Sumerlaeota bacterium]|nr:preprotein translocase subunit SecE [Candidatus Sumerlaeota bacterium]HMZ50742.1 preprotein translocase subunit SecE [Candidatus Sumerlaeota bacterium]HNM47103.1 preprotein translocase subunit SecE [Candidatus Sumerlaeota bacterium]
MFEKTKIFYGEVRTEMAKVVWPTTEQVKTWTMVTIISTAIFAACLGAWDFVLTWIVGKIFGFGS